MFSFLYGLCVNGFRSQGFQQYFMPPATQNIVQNVDTQNGFSNTAFWDYLPFLDDAQQSVRENPLI
jgi:hypothetical protein